MGQKDWKRFFREIKEKKDRWLILLLVGILLIIIALPVSDRKKNSNAGDRKTASEEEYGSIGGLTDDSYTRRLEIRLEEALHQVKGVGNVSVMITLSSSSEKVVEKDREISSESSEGGEGGNTSSNSSSSETSVYSGNGGDESPYVKKEISPGIEGVLIIAEGGDDAVVIENITEAVQALFGVDTHKIKVMKHN